MPSFTCIVPQTRRVSGGTGYALAIAYIDVQKLITKIRKMPSRVARFFAFFVKKNAQPAEKTIHRKRMPRTILAHIGVGMV